MLSIDRNHLNVHALLKLTTVLNLCSLRAPVFGKLRRKNNIVRIPHRNRNPSHLAIAQLYC
jgi:hypothetical protein